MRKPLVRSKPRVHNTLIWYKDTMGSMKEAIKYIESCLGNCLTVRRPDRRVRRDIRYYKQILKYATRITKK